MTRLPRALLRSSTVLALFLSALSALAGPATVQVKATREVAVGKLKAASPIHTNRNYAYTDVPKPLAGLQYTLHAHKSTGALSCLVTKDGTLTLCLPQGVKPPETDDLGEDWEDSKLRIKAQSPSSTWHVYTREVKAGDEMKIPSTTKWGAVLLAKEIKGLKAYTAPAARKASKSVVQGTFDNRGYWKNPKITSQVFRTDALILESDKTPLDVVLRRAAALLADIQGMDKAPDLTKEAALLLALKARNTDGLPEDQQKALLDEASALRRQIAFRNPLLDFESVLFVKHHRSRGNHMCDQYFGKNAQDGGGVFLLKDAFGAAPEVRDLLADQVIGKGRLDGQKPEGGSFMALDLSYDAKTLLFARVELGAKTKDGLERFFHIYKCNADGSGLTQLTDGPWNDFDPCFLPNGRIVFISERIGGFGRCHPRSVPTYTLHSMLPDGSDIIPISYHETNEWHPSVDNHGMIVYSRWDYVDRDSDIAHHIWHTFPDGRDPRSYHGNYPTDRRSRPWMELSNRAIPNSDKYICVAAPHHGQNYGTLVLLDMRTTDDRSMSQLKRVTPDVPFPESEGGGHEVYGTPWPLSEDYYLCVYDTGRRNYGLFLLDSFGNLELLYQDPSIACLDPIPLKPRPRPPIIPAKTTQASADRRSNTDTATGIVTVLNVYASEIPFPEGTTIKALRIVNIFPKATPIVNKPSIGYANQSLARGVLGTVPVEADGSAHFRVPTGIPIYFQALDEQGMVVQSMRSNTYVHAGETLGCIGCHEPKSAAPPTKPKAPIALRRPPSAITPEVEGSYPLSFPRLVQPVLDKKCVGCHEKNRTKKAPSLLGKVAKNSWSEAFTTLYKYGWGKHGGNGSIRKNGGSTSIPGKVCANASKLYALLHKGHHDVVLTAEEMRRITLWIDCNTNFFGAYLDTEKQAKGEVVKPRFGTPPGIDFAELVR